MTFEMWGWKHVIFMLMPIIVFFVLHFSCKEKSEKTKQTVGIVVSAVGVLLLLLRGIETWVVKGPNGDMIPLQVCHLATILLFVAFLTRNKTLFAMMFCFFMPAAIMAILFASALANPLYYPTIINFRGLAYIMGHTLIVGPVLWAVSIKFITISFKTLLKSLLFALYMYVAALLVTNFVYNVLGFTDANFFYSIAPETGTPLAYFYTFGSMLNWGGFMWNPLYMIATMLFGYTVMFALYGVYSIVGLLLKYSR
jgi:uncharacterized membrane protein YwaF